MKLTPVNKQFRPGFNIWVLTEDPGDYLDTILTKYIWSTLYPLQDIRFTSIDISIYES